MTSRISTDANKYSNLFRDSTKQKLNYLNDQSTAPFERCQVGVQHIAISLAIREPSLCRFAWRTLMLKSDKMREPQTAFGLYIICISL